MSDRLDWHDHEWDLLTFDFVAGEVRETVSFGWPGYNVPGTASKPAVDKPADPSPSGPSAKALAAAKTVDAKADVALAKAHDVKLGLDRSVCLREVVEWLTARGYGRDGRRAVEDFLRDFGVPG